MSGSAAGAVRSPPHSPAGQRLARHVPRVPGAGPARSSGVHRLGSRRSEQNFHAWQSMPLARAASTSIRVALSIAHGTRAPDGFENNGREGNSVIGVTRTWKDIGGWRRTTSTDPI